MGSSDTLIKIHSSVLLSLGWFAVSGNSLQATSIFHSLFPTPPDWTFGWGKLFPSTTATFSMTFHKLTDQKMYFSAWGVGVGGKEACREKEVSITLWSEVEKLRSEQTLLGMTRKRVVLVLPECASRSFLGFLHKTKGQAWGLRSKGFCKCILLENTNSFLRMIYVTLLMWLEKNTCFEFPSHLCKLSSQVFLAMPFSDSLCQILLPKVCL